MFLYNSSYIYVLLVFLFIFFNVSNFLFISDFFFYLDIIYFFNIFKNIGKSETNKYLITIYFLTFIYYFILYLYINIKV
jgi:hypothetical protein